MRVFISHSNKEEDLQIVKRLEAYLEKRNVVCWVDYSNINKTGSWADQIGEGLIEASAFIVVASKNSLTSPECDREIRIVTNSETKNYDKTIPFFIDDYYFENEACRKKYTYLLGSYQGVKASKYSDIEDAFFALFSLLPDEIIQSDGSNLSNFVFDGTKTAIVGYHGSDSEVRIPQIVKRICERAFLKCGTMETVIIPDSVEEINKYAFADCGNLRVVKGLNGVKKCSRTAAEKSPVVQSDGGVKYFGNIALGLDSIDKQDEIVIREGTRVIAIGAFREEFDLKSVTLPDSVVSICASAFKDCINLGKINLPEGVQIADTAFEGCNKLTNRRK